MVGDRGHRAMEARCPFSLASLVGHGLTVYGMNTPGWMIPVILVLVGFLVVLALVGLLS